MSWQLETALLIVSGIQTSHALDSGRLYRPKGLKLVKTPYFNKHILFIGHSHSLAGPNICILEYSRWSIFGKPPLKLFPFYYAHLKDFRYKIEINVLTFQMLLKFVYICEITVLTAKTNSYCLFFKITNTGSKLIEEQTVYKHYGYYMYQNYTALCINKYPEQCQ